MDMFTRLSKKTGMRNIFLLKDPECELTCKCNFWAFGNSVFYVFIFHRSPNGKYFALKQIEGTGISMSACREIAVSIHKLIGSYQIQNIYSLSCRM